MNALAPREQDEGVVRGGVRRVIGRFPARHLCPCLLCRGMVAKQG